MRWSSSDPKTFYLFVGFIVLLVMASQMVKVHVPSRPRGTIEDLDTIRDSKPNVVFVVVDTLRSDRLSAYGYERLTSKYMTNLASVGILFSRTVAQSSWTKSSMASIWSSQYPSQLGVTRFSNGLPEELRLPADIFKEAGYRTVGLYRNGWVAPNFGFHQGFDQYQNPIPSRTAEMLERQTVSSYKLPGSDHAVTDSAVEFLGSIGDEPFFLYLHYMDVHQYVYDDTSDFGVTFSDFYDNSISWVDRNIGMLAYTLEEEGLLENTVLVVASDHGEAFGEHGTEGHARNLYREVTETPFIISLPFRLKEKLEIDHWVQNIDIWPTILDLVGLPEIPDAQGISLVPLITAVAKGEDPPPEFVNRPTFSYLDRTWGSERARTDPLIATTVDGYRLIVPMCFHNRAELYNVEKDRIEKVNLSRKRLEIQNRLTQHLVDFVNLPESGFPATEQEVDALTRGQLLALGYVIEEDRKDMKGPEGEDPRGCENPTAPVPFERSTELSQSP